jgi:hypothetical protein
LWFRLEGSDDSAGNMEAPVAFEWRLWWLQMVALEVRRLAVDALVVLIATMASVGSMSGGLTRLLLVLVAVL